MSSVETATGNGWPLQTSFWPELFVEDWSNCSELQAALGQAVHMVLLHGSVCGISIDGAHQW